MKKTEPHLKIADALKRVKADFPEIPVVAIHAAIREGRIPHRRSSLKKKARIFVQETVLRYYLESLTR